MTKLFTISDDGIVAKVEVLSCHSVKGDTDLKLVRERDGNNCQQFSTNSDWAPVDWKLPVLHADLQEGPWTQLWQVVFALQNTNSYDINSQSSASKARFS